MINFSKRISKEAKQRYEKRKQEETKRTVGKVVAKDSGGNVYEKTVILSEDLKVISFGWPVEYILNDLLDNLDRNKDAESFCIDVGGRNHRGIEDVCILLKDVISIADKAVILRASIKRR
jgi:hypothetical protein